MSQLDNVVEPNTDKAIFKKPERERIPKPKPVKKMGRRKGQNLANDDESDSGTSVCSQKSTPALEPTNWTVGYDVTVATLSSFLKLLSLLGISKWLIIFLIF